MPLSFQIANAAKAKDKPYKLYDERGLFLLVTTSGGKLWRLKFRHNKKEKLLALGKFPDVSLAAARLAAEEAREVIKKGEDPSFAKRTGKDPAYSLQALAKTWIKTRLEGVGKKPVLPITAQKIEGQLARHVFPVLGTRPITSITPKELEVLLQKVEITAPVTAKAMRQALSSVFRFAIKEGITKENPADMVRESLKTIEEKHHAGITDEVELGALLRAIDNYQGGYVVLQALKLLPYAFVRMGELRQASWAEIDLDAALWTIPATRAPLDNGERVSAMKMKEPHAVPLSRQAIALLKDLRRYTGDGRFVFTSMRGNTRPLSNAAVGVALKTMGYDGDTVTAHGFRTTASTLLERLGYDSDLIERQLAHQVGNKVKRAYKSEQWRAKLPERAKMMQEWADFLDDLRGKNQKTP